MTKACPCPRARTEAGGCIQALCPPAVRGGPRDSLVPVCGHSKHMAGFCPVQALSTLGNQCWRKASSCWAREGFSMDIAFAFHDLKQATLFLFTLNNYTSMQVLLLLQCGRYPTKSGVCILLPFRSPGYLKQSLACHWKTQSSSAARVLTPRSWLCQAW